MPKSRKSPSPKGPDKDKGNFDSLFDAYLAGEASYEDLRAADLAAAARPQQYTPIEKLVLEAGGTVMQDDPAAAPAN